MAEDGQKVGLRAVIYARCSTSEQDYTRQLTELQGAADRLGWRVVATLGSTVSGGSNESDLSRLQAAARRGEYDRLMVWELSRLSRRGIGPLLHLIQQFDAQGVRVYSIREPWVGDDGPARELLVAILAWAARWEREMISARTKSALASRKALGIHVGRPKGSRDRVPRVRRAKRGGSFAIEEPAPL